MNNDKVSTISIIIASFVVVIAVFVGVLTGWYFYSKTNVKPQENPPVGEIKLSPQLSQQQISDLIKAMSVSATATPALSKTQLDKLSKSMSASKDAKPVLSADEQKKLVESMSAR